MNGQQALFPEEPEDIVKQWESYCQAEHDWYLSQKGEDAQRMLAAYRNIRASSINKLIEEVRAARLIIEAIRPPVSGGQLLPTKEYLQELLGNYDKVVKNV